MSNSIQSKSYNSIQSNSNSKRNYMDGMSTSIMPSINTKHLKRKTHHIDSLPRKDMNSPKQKSVIKRKITVTQFLDDLVEESRKKMNILDKHKQELLKQEEISINKIRSLIIKISKIKTNIKGITDLKQNTIHNNRFAMISKRIFELQNRNDLENLVDKIGFEKNHICDNYGLKDLLIKNDPCAVDFLFYLLFQGYYRYSTGDFKKVKLLKLFLFLLEEASITGVMQLNSRPLSYHVYAFVLDNFVKKVIKNDVINNLNYKFEDIEISYMSNEYNNFKQRPDYYSISNTEITMMLNAFIDYKITSEFDENEELFMYHKTKRHRYSAGKVKRQNILDKTKKKKNISNNKKNGNLKKK